jgi:hypothetical protein
MITGCVLSLAAFYEAENTAICSAIGFGKSGILLIFLYVFHVVKSRPLKKEQLQKYFGFY